MTTLDDINTYFAGQLANTPQNPQSTLSLGQQVIADLTQYGPVVVPGETTGVVYYVDDGPGFWMTTLLMATNANSADT